MGWITETGRQSLLELCTRMKCKIKIEDKEYIGDITRRMDVGTYEVWVDELQQNYYISKNNMIEMDIDE